MHFYKKKGDEIDYIIKGQHVHMLGGKMTINDWDHGDCMVVLGVQSSCVFLSTK